MMTDGPVTGVNLYCRMQMAGVEQIEPPLAVTAEQA
jgi:hypothetical protein